MTPVHRMKVEICPELKCVLAKDHFGEHQTRRISMLACPHNVPNFGPPCQVCDETL